jgi:histidinol dehydrogenase
MIKIYKYKSTPDVEIFARGDQKSSIAKDVADIILAVREKGDAALFEFCEKFDRVKLESLEVSRDEIKSAAGSVGADFMGVLERSAANIRSFHSKQVRKGFSIEKNGVILGQKITPIEKVGVYVPGGTAPLASTVLMDVIPAKIAGCPSVIMCTPAGRDGKINPAVLAAAYVAGVNRVFAVGGAQAIAAMAYGTETVPEVYKIVGPGNAYVAEAKKQVYGKVSIDMIAGPSEILIVADGSCNPAYVAADMLSQAEHDKMASAVLVTDSETLADAVSAELEKQIPQLPRCETARTSIDSNGKIIITDSISEAIEISNRIAPEHIEICVDNPIKYLPEIKNAGSIFLGKNCPEPLGDYYAGPNHTLPTGGTAKFSSPLSVDDFIKKSSYTYYTNDALAAAADDIIKFAEREELRAHARSVAIRCECEKENK